jgi:cytoskeletal protein CcmA (bactofilin family)
MANYTTELSVLGPSTQVVGKVAGRGGIRVEGPVRGDIEVDGPGIIGEGGSVQGNFHAESLDIAGVLQGDAVTVGPIRVQAGATVRGELKGSQISIAEGARVSVVLEADFELNL